MTFIATEDANLSEKDLCREYVEDRASVTAEPRRCDFDPFARLPDRSRETVLVRYQTMTTCSSARARRHPATTL